MMDAKLIAVSLFLSLGFCQLLPNSAQAIDEQCSMRRADGTVMDLGKLCGQNTPTKTAPTPVKPIKPVKEEVGNSNCSESAIAKYIASFSTKEEMTAFEALIKCKAKSVPALIKASTKFIKTQDLGLIPAGIALVKIGKDAVPELLIKLKDPDPKIRSWAIGMLGQMQEKDAVPNIISALKDPDKLVRFSAVTIFEIGKIPLGKNTEKAVTNLIPLLTDPDRNIRIYSATALGNIGSEAQDAIPALTLALKDPDINVQNYAASALKKIK
jgi:HEAT repeat protein